MAVLTCLRLIQFRAAYNLPVLAANQCGIFAKHGLAVDVAYTPGSDFLIAALTAGEFEIGHTAADDVVAARARARGPRDPLCDLFLFMGLHSGLLSVVAGPGYRDAGSLKGQTLGVDSKSTGFVFLLEKFLRSNGLVAGDYVLSEIGGWEQRHRALLEKRIAATLLTSPYLEDAVESGCTILARGDDIQRVYQATCGAAKRAWAKENPDALVKYIRAYVEAARWCFHPENRRACLDLLDRHMGLDENRGAKTLAALLDPGYGLYPLAEINIPGLAAVLALRAESGHFALSKTPVKEYFDLSYHQNAFSDRLHQ
jgi:ABC-type nitrate/sulfonate/bicarbonate transport system substrate-binding protein